MSNLSSLSPSGWGTAVPGEELAHERAIFGVQRAGSDIANGVGCGPEYLGLIDQCHGFIERRLPCRRYNAECYAVVCLLSFRWPERFEAQTGDLLRAYLRAGYARLNDQVDALGASDYSSVFPKGATLLEIAIRQGQRAQAVALIGAGEDPGLRPCRRTPVDSEYPDMFALAEAYWGGPMRAILVEAVMARKLDSRPSAEASNGTCMDMQRGARARRLRV